MELIINIIVIPEPPLPSTTPATTPRPTPETPLPYSTPATTPRPTPPPSFYYDTTSVRIYSVSYNICLFSFKSVWNFNLISNFYLILYTSLITYLSELFYFFESNLRYTARTSEMHPITKKRKRKDLLRMVVYIYLLCK